MIVAKTRMKKIPESCKDCKFSTTEYGGRCCRIAIRFCPMKQSEHKNWKYFKPDWCPLIEIDGGVK